MANGWLGYYVARFVGEQLEGRAREDGEYLLPDERARQAACKRLSEDRELDVSAVRLKVLSGELTLEGGVPDLAMKARAEQICVGVPGVAKVVNALRVTG